jgi:hypothetical protein
MNLMRNLPMISVVMPALNAETYIGATVRALNQQTYRRWQLLLIDDGSQDATVEIALESAENPVHVIRHDIPQGVASSLNDGLTSASGELIMRLDSDDICEPERMERAVSTFASNPELDAMATSFRYISTDGAFLPVFDATCAMGPAEVSFSLLLQNVICHPSVVLRHNSVNSVRYSSDYLWEDYELWLRMRSLWQWNIAPHTTLRWRLHRGNQSRTNVSDAARQISVPLASAWAAAGVQVAQPTALELVNPGSSNDPKNACEAWRLVRLWESTMRRLGHDETRRWALRAAAQWRMRALAAQGGSAASEFLKDIVHPRTQILMAKAAHNVAVRRAAGV